MTSECSIALGKPAVSSRAEAKKRPITFTCLAILRIKTSSAMMPTVVKPHRSFILSSNDANPERNDLVASLQIDTHSCKGGSVMDDDDDDGVYSSFELEEEELPASHFCKISDFSEFKIII